MDKKLLLERLSDLEHQQWESWSKAIADLLEKAGDVIDELTTDNPNATAMQMEVLHRIDKKIKSWNTYWVPYEELEDSIQEYDRVWARKVLDIVEEG